MKSTMFAALVLLIAGGSSAKEADLKAPASVVQQLLDAAKANDTATFARLLDNKPGMIASEGRGLPLGFEPPTLQPLTVTAVVEAFRDCKLTTPKTIDPSMAVVRAKCVGKKIPEDSYFLVVDGKVRTFYKFLPPPLQIAPRQN